MSADFNYWLESIGLGEYAQLFSNNGIDFRAIHDVTEQDFIDLGVKLGHRRVLQREIENLASVVRPPKMEDIEGAQSASDVERRQLTVMFCDLVGSTKLSQELDPEDMRKINLAFQEACKIAIEGFNGYVARYMGDGVLAYFGYPLAHEDAAERAIHAGLEVIKATRAIDVDYLADSAIELDVRVGIATGPVVVGDLIGHGASRENAVVGETPNLAARLQGIAEPGCVVVGTGTKGLVPGCFEFEELGVHELRGYYKPVPAWRIVKPVDAESRFDARHPAELTPLIGREHEIGLVSSRWEQSINGEGQVVLLSGEAGIGKSRIVEAFRELIESEVPEIVLYQCSPHHTSAVLYPFTERLKRAADFKTEDSNVTKLAKLRSYLASNSDDADSATRLFAPMLNLQSKVSEFESEISPEKRRELVFERFVQTFEKVSADNRCLVIFEDVHWCDPTSIDLLGIIIDRIQRLPILLVITHRTSYVHPWNDSTHVTSLTLNRLSRNLTIAMLDKLSQGRLLPDDLSRQIIEKTDGMPLFIEEFTKSVLESGVLRECEDRYELSGPLLPLNVPATLHDSLMARLDRLGPKDIAQFAAAIGREFSADLLKAASGIENDKLKEHLEKLLDAGLVLRRGKFSDGAYIFKHALVRDAAYESLLNARRVQIHSQIASAIELGTGADAESKPQLLAHHLELADRLWEASEYWLTAGMKAKELSALVEAESYLESALNCLTKVEPSVERSGRELEILSALGNVLMAIRGYGATKVRDTFQKAISISLQLGESDFRKKIYYGLWANHFSLAELNQCLEIASEIIDVSSQSEDKIWKMLGLRLHAFTVLTQGDVAQALSQSRAAIDLYDEASHISLAYDYSQDPKVALLMCQAWSLWSLGYPDKALEKARLCVLHAEKINHPHTIAYAYAWSLSRIHLLRGEPKDCLAASNHAREICTQYGFPVHLSTVLLDQAVAYSMLGNTDLAQKGVER